MIIKMLLWVLQDFANVYWLSFKVHTCIHDAQAWYIYLNRCILNTILCLLFENTKNSTHWFHSTCQKILYIYSKVILTRIWHAVVYFAYRNGEMFSLTVVFKYCFWFSGVKMKKILTNIVKDFAEMALLTRGSER